jgi:transposase InsO family protein
MQYQHIGYGIKGFYRIANLGLKVSQMSESAKKRGEIVAFWRKHGLLATMDAFKVSRRTLYGWKKRLKAGGGKLSALSNGSRAPKQKRSRYWPALVIGEIRGLRKKYPNLAKEKIYPLLKPWCEQRQLRCPSIRTIGRLIADAPDRMRSMPVRLRPNGKAKTLKRVKKARKPKDFKAAYPGHCVALDSIERFHNGIRRYVITFKDCYSRFGFAIATSSHASRAAKTFLQLVQTVFPFKLQHVLTDNGSEFMKDFQAELDKIGSLHWHTYPKTPKMNAHCERFNRTLQDEFIDYHESDLFYNLASFNDRLMDYLLWFNGQRPHFALNLHPKNAQPFLLSPVQYLLYHNHQCNMWWPDTHPCILKQTAYNRSCTAA